MLISPIQILIIEDDVEDIRILKTLLAKATNFPNHLTIASNLTEALEILQGSARIDAIFLDIFLPEEQGLNSFTLLYEKVPNIPIIILSGNTNEELAIAAVKQGAQDYLVKGEFDRQLLVRATRYAIERNRQRLELARQKSLSQTNQARFHTIVAKSVDGILILNAAGAIIFANPSAEKIFKRSVGELVGNFFGLPLSEDEIVEVEVVRPSGEIAIVEMRIVEIDWDNEIAYYATLRDITARKIAEKAIQKKAKQENMLFQISERIRQSLDLKEILSTAVKEIQSLLNCDRISIYRFYENNLGAIEEEAFSDKYISVGKYQQEKLTIANISPELIEGIAIDPHYIEYRGILPLQSSLVKPINISRGNFTEGLKGYGEERLWGLLIAQEYRSMRKWQLEEIESLDLLGIKLAIAIQQAELYQRVAAANEQLQKLVSYDFLTEVFNRRYFDEQLEREWGRTIRESAPIALIIVDIDYFKLYNDTYGHQAGDKCLHDVAQAIAKCLQRSGDFIARYGGEEFAIVLPNTNSQGAYHVAQKIRQTIKNLKIPNSASLHDTIVTISLGIASIIPSVNLGYEILIQAADRALYWSKNQGRDRVRVYPEQFHELGKVK